MRHYFKILGLRAWAIVQRPVWKWVVGIGALYTFLQVAAHQFADRLVSIFDALYPWWYVPIAVLALCVLLRAGYELWREEAQAREKVEARLENANQEREGLGTKLQETEQENEKLKKKLEAARSSVGVSAPSINSLIEERDELKKEVRKYKNNDWWREGFYREVEAERDAFKEENEQLKPDANRMRLRRKLIGYLEEGELLCTGYTKEDDQVSWNYRVAAWYHKTHSTIQEALGETQAGFYVGYRPNPQSKYAPEKNAHDVLINVLRERLDRLKQILNRIDNLPLQPDFDPQGRV